MVVLTLRGRGPNTFSLSMLREVERELDAAGDEPLLVTGAGEAFSAGLDLDELGTHEPAQVVELLSAMERVARRLFLHPAPTVALVNGHAVAGGCLVAQCCDWRVGVDDDAIRIGMTGVAIGLTYPPFVVNVFRQRVPAPHLENALLGAQRVDPKRALAAGLLDELAPKDDARKLAISRLEARAMLPRHAYAATKRALREPLFHQTADEERRFKEETVPEWTKRLMRL